MASDKAKLIIHTNQLHTSDPREQTPAKPRFVRKRKQRSLQERLLRNSCLACALLLGILALGNIQQPWARQFSASIQKALTMEIDLDKSLGQLRFVQKLMPESALVFFNLNGDSEFTLPVDGTLTHPYSDPQPWLMFSCDADQPVYACADGTVSAVSPMSDGGYGLLLDHGSGVESVTACLSSVNVQPGTSVVKGSVIGKSSSTLYYELRENENSTDPTLRMGL